MKNVLIPVDGSGHANKALELACTIASAEDAELTLVYVCAPSDIIHTIPDSLNEDFSIRLGAALHKIGFPDVIDPVQSPEAALSAITDHVRKSTAINRVIGENTLERAVEKTSHCGIERVRSELLIGKPADEILDFISKYNTDTVVMGSRGMGAFSGALTGSVSQSVLHNADCTVIIVK